MNEQEIFEHLVKNPGYVYITPDGKKLYALASEEDGMFLFEGDFTNMSEEDVNEFIQNAMRKFL